MRLCDMNLGDKACVGKIHENINISQRFLDIGLIPGTKVECVLISPSKNPKAYMIRGAVIAIRNEDAVNVDINCI